MSIKIKGLSIALLSLTLPAVVSGQTTANVMTNASVVRLVKAGFSEKSLISIIRSRPSRFDLGTERLVELKKSGVSEKIILEMLAHEEETVISEDGWSDDPFFKSSSPNMGAAGNSNNPGEINIFGSGGGTRGRTTSRGNNGSNDGETHTVGSASVKILRSPSESGSEPPKLERAQTLTNDKIVELVDAGFTEGTIIRRIEQSPVEFDLSKSRLDELRQKRVSDKIIAAMSLAMGEAPAADSRE
jgi:hypothetical protein